MPPVYRLGIDFFCVPHSSEQMCWSWNRARQDAKYSGHETLFMSCKETDARHSWHTWIHTPFNKLGTETIYCPESILKRKNGERKTPSSSQHGSWRKPGELTHNTRCQGKYWVPARTIQTGDANKWTRRGDVGVGCASVCTFLDGYILGDGSEIFYIKFLHVFYPL